MDHSHIPTGSAASEALLAPIINAPADRPFVVAQLGQSLDGRIATVTGDSRWINRELALDHLHRLRAAVDAVVVGIGTVLADDPQLTVRRVEGRQPARVVIDPQGRLPAQPRCFAENGARTYVVRACGTPAPAGVETIRIARTGETIAPAAIVAALWERGLRRLLIEGGAQTISAFLDAGMIDRLHVLVSPIILGSGRAGLQLAPIERLDQAIRPPTTVHVFADGDVLFDCALRVRSAIA